MYYGGYMGVDGRECLWTISLQKEWANIKTLDLQEAGMRFYPSAAIVIRGLAGTVRPYVWMCVYRSAKHTQHLVYLAFVLDMCDVARRWVGFVATYIRGTGKVLVVTRGSDIHVRLSWRCYSSLTMFGKMPCSMLVIAAWICLSWERISRWVVLREVTL